MSSQTSDILNYRTADPVVPKLMALLVPRRQFSMAGGVWRERPRKRGRIRRFALVLASVSAIGWGLERYYEMPVPVTLASAVGRDVPVYLDIPATVQANQTVTVHAQMDGQLSEILFREGQDVKKGDVLAKIDPRNYQMQYDEAVVTQSQDEALLAKAKNSLAKFSASRPKHGSTKEWARTLDDKRVEVRQFEAALKADASTVQALKTQLDRSVLVSPIDGRAGIRLVDAGNMVHASDPNGIVVITQLEPVTALFSVPQKSLRPVSDRIAKGETVKVLALDTDNGRVLDEGTLQLVDSQLDPMTGQARLKASFPNHKRVLWPGASVRMRLTVSLLKGTVVVPAASVHYQEAEGDKSAAKPWIYVLEKDSQRIAAREVTVAMTQDGDAMISEGLRPGDQVVLHSDGVLADGSKVTEGSVTAR